VPIRVYRIFLKKVIIFGMLVLPNLLFY
jgi:hypothetical protein